MIAYKTWYDTKHYIHKDSTKENVIWTIDVNDAKVTNGWVSTYNFFFEYLGFHINESLPDSLKII